MMDPLTRLELAFMQLENEVAAEYLRETGEVACDDTVKRMIAELPELRFRERLAAALKSIDD